MNKSFIITFSISVIVFATTVVILLMLLLPKQLVYLKTSVEKYQSIEKSNYTYTKTKDISKEALLKEYKITSNDIVGFKNSYKYVAGNSDPFARGEETPSTNTSDGGSTSATPNATDRTTNSNGGVSNPVSITK